MQRTIKSIFLLLIISATAYGQNIDKAFFDEANTFFQQYITEGRVNYKSLQTTGDLVPLIIKVEKANLDGTDEETSKAFYLNAYNLYVIYLVLRDYPLRSVQDIPGFFDKNKINVAGNNVTLNQLEKDFILKPFNDSRIHFVLICGAIGCPPITNFAYSPKKLEAQLEQQTRTALNEFTFIRTNGDKTEISQIFKWYIEDFGGTKSRIIDYINNYRSTPISKNTIYYPYDWTLNDTNLTDAPSSKDKKSSTSIGNNERRYVISSAIPIGSYEMKIFNNLYSQKTGSDGIFTDRSSFFTTTITALYGFTNRLNVGINTRWRKVRNHALPSLAFAVFGSGEDGGSRSGLTAFGPMVRWAAIPQWENFSIQSSYTFSIGDDLKGNSTDPFIDWNGAIWNTQFFNDFPIGDNFSLFTEVDFIWEDIGRDMQNEGVYFDNKTSTPLTVILSYFPTLKTTIYALTGYAPSWSLENNNGESGLTINDYFYQGGIGGKHQFTPNFEIELLYSYFTTKFLKDSEGQAATYNLGLRFNL